MKIPSFRKRVFPLLQAIQRTLKMPEEVEHHMTVRVTVDKWIMKHPLSGKDVELELVPPEKGG